MILWLIFCMITPFILVMCADVSEDKLSPSSGYMGAVCSSIMLVSPYQNTCAWYHRPEDHDITKGLRQNSHSRPWMDPRSIPEYRVGVLTTMLHSSCLSQMSCHCVFVSSLTCGTAKRLTEKKFSLCSFPSQRYIWAHLLGSAILLLSSWSGMKDAPCIQMKRWASISS